MSCSINELWWMQPAGIRFKLMTRVTAGRDHWLFRLALIGQGQDRFFFLLLLHIRILVWWTHHRVYQAWNHLQETNIATTYAKHTKVEKLRISGCPAKRWNRGITCWRWRCTERVCPRLRNFNRDIVWLVCLRLWRGIRWRVTSRIASARRNLSEILAELLSYFCKRTDWILLSLNAEWHTGAYGSIINNIINNITQWLSKGSLSVFLYPHGVNFEHWLPLFHQSRARDCCWFSCSFSRLTYYSMMWKNNLLEHWPSWQMPDSYPGKPMKSSNFASSRQTETSKTEHIFVHSLLAIFGDLTLSQLMSSETKSVAKPQHHFAKICNFRDVSTFVYELHF